MHPIALLLLERHVEFELDALTDERIAPYLRSEIDTWFEVAAREPLSAFVTEERCLAAMQRVVVEASIPPSAGEFVLWMFFVFAQRLEDAEVEVQEVIGKERFLELVHLFAGLHEPRRRFVAELLHHPFYSELISSLVYEALLNYLIEDNLISQNVPGVGSMLKLGRKVASRAVPGLDATVERQLKGFIKGNLPSLIKTSEQFVEDILTDEQLEEQAANAWAGIRSMRLAELGAGVNREDAEGLGRWGRAYWDELRGSEFLVDMIETLIANVFQEYGDEPLKALLDDFGITPRRVGQELVTLAPPLLKQLREAGYLEALLRRRLTPFYASEVVAEILDSTQDG